MDTLEILKFQLGEHFVLREKRPGIMQVVAPFYHEDGDMLDIFIEMPKKPGDSLRISDYGNTLMRLSYSCDLGDPRTQAIFARMLSQNGVRVRSSELFINTEPEMLFADLMCFVQTVAKVGTLALLNSALESAAPLD